MGLQRNCCDFCLCCIILKITLSYSHSPEVRPVICLTKMKEQSLERVLEVIEMERLTDYTCNPEYLTEWNKLMTAQDALMAIMNNHSASPKITLYLFGDVEVGHFRMYSNVVQQAFVMKMRMTSYWNIVLRRLVDVTALHLQLTVQNLVNKEMKIEIVNEMMGPCGGELERSWKKPLLLL